jgi:hypothetical protein
MELAVARGADPATLAASAGVEAEHLEDVDRRIPLTRYMALMRAGQALSGDPALALHYGETSDLAQISVVGLIAYACETFAEALVQLNRYGRLVVEVDGPEPRFSHVLRDGGIWLVDNRAAPNDFPELTESTFARAICGPRRFGVTQIATAVHVTHAARPYGAEYERIFGAPVTFAAGWNALRLDTAWMSHPISVQPRYVFGVLIDHADALLAALEASKSTRGRVETLLMPSLHEGQPSMAAVAARMGVSRQTLFRRLKAEGASPSPPCSMSCAGRWRCATSRRRRSRSTRRPTWSGFPRRPPSPAPSSAGPASPPREARQG